jgi:hypothetical protein
MGTVHKLLPRLVMNREFLADFLDAEVPCFAMGVVEERKTSLAFLALRTAENIPDDITAGGFSFGHSVFANSEFETVHFAFEFYGFHTYNTLVNPNNPIARTVLKLMIDQGEYFFFAVNPSRSATAFKAEVGEYDLGGILPFLDRIMASKTTDRQYEKAVASFTKNPEPPGTMLNWVCRDKAEYLDLTGDTFVLNPA